MKLLEVDNVIPVKISYFDQDIDGEVMEQIVFLDLLKEEVTSLGRPLDPVLREQLVAFIKEKKTTPVRVPMLSQDQINGAIEKSDGSLMRGMPDGRNKN